MITGTIEPQATVGELVRERPARARVFEALGIDYCCGGKLPLGEAAARRGLDVRQIVEQLAAADAAAPADDVDYAAMTLTALADHIEATHHAYLRRELPRLRQLAAKVAQVHGAKDERLARVATVVQRLSAELSDHMQKEEMILFPMIRQLDAADGPVAFHCGSMANPIRVMEFEHDTAGNALGELRSLSDEYSPPEWACNTYRALLDGLATLEADLHQHIHKENNILFPAALEREAHSA
jgi:regulator of cell morphogenesis and NO signaling